MKKASKKDMILLFFAGALLFFGGLSLLFFPAPRFSQFENRLLAEKPSFSFASLADGSYTAAWESYTAERVAGRRLLRGVHAVCELSLGKCQTGEVLYCRDGSLTKRLRTNPHSYQKNLTGIKKLIQESEESGISLTVAIAPRRMDARKNVLPALFKTAPESSPYQALSDKLPTATVFDIEGDEAWYRTDHHWTTEGAYAAYCVLSKELGFTPYNRSDFSKETVCDAFWGTTDAAAGLLDTPPDKIELWRYSGDDLLTLTKDGKSAPFHGLYNFEKSKTRDGYAVFLGGNDGIVEITQGTEDPRQTLLLIKDSFANSVIPFLARHYRIIAIDPRYTNADLNPYFTMADQALLLMGMQTLAEIALF